MESLLPLQLGDSTRHSPPPGLRNIPQPPNSTTNQAPPPRAPTSLPLTAVLTHPIPPRPHQTLPPTPGCRQRGIPRRVPQPLASASHNSGEDPPHLMPLTCVLLPMLAASILLPHASYRPHPSDSRHLTTCITPRSLLPPPSTLSREKEEARITSVQP